MSIPYSHFKTSQEVTLRQCWLLQKILSIVEKKACIVEMIMYNLDKLSMHTCRFARIIANNDASLNGLWKRQASLDYLRGYPKGMAIFALQDHMTSTNNAVRI